VAKPYRPVPEPIKSQAVSSVISSAAWQGEFATVSEVLETAASEAVLAAVQLAY
jgi:hypothetical protein